MVKASGVSVAQARGFLRVHHGHDIGPLELVGEGGWSRAFGYKVGERDLVVRFGGFVEDFEKDRLASTYASPALPVPDVVYIGPALGGHAAISTRAFGAPLESLDAEAWRAVLPSLEAALDAMRSADLAGATGFGLWDGMGRGPTRSWRSFLLSIGDDREDRLPGWRGKLAAWPAEQAAFDASLVQLHSLVDACPETRSLVHGDLINGNVLVEGDMITSVFDWGCALWGDPLYDLACLSFWAPWHVGLDAIDIRGRVLDHWAEAGVHLADVDARLRCYWLHLALENIEYNAFLGHRSDAAATSERLSHVLTRF